MTGRRGGASAQKPPPKPQSGKTGKPTSKQTSIKRK